MPLETAQAHNDKPVALDETTLDIGLVFGAGFTLLVTVIAAGLWVGRLQEKVQNQEKQMKDLDETLTAIQKTLEGIDMKIEQSHKEFKKELLEEIKRAGLATESNIESYFNGALIEQRLLNAQFQKDLAARNRTINEIKAAVNRIGADAREAKAQARLIWEMNCPSAGDPPSRPGNYRQ